MNDEKIVVALKKVNVATATLQELRDLVGYLQSQMNNTYMYLVGEWAGGHHARSTRDGKLVSNDEVKRYLP